MRYVLMQCGNAACEFEYDFDSGICHVGEVYDHSFLPFSMRYQSDAYLNSSLAVFLSRRTIPEYRKGTGALYRAIGGNRIENSFRSYGLSLSDCYWVRPYSSAVRWNDVNFFRNRFSYDIGNFIFGIEKENPNILSPDLTTNGMLPKTWRVHNGKICLLKAGSAPDFIEPYNEAAASALLQKLGILPFVKYKVITIRDVTVSVCENFLKDGEEYVPASEIAASDIRPPFMTMDMHIRTRCRDLGIPKYKEFLDRMHYLDYLISNTDRNLGNYGFIYNVNEQKFTGPAPIFDCGTSFFTDINFEQTQEKAKKMLDKIRKPHRFPKIKVDNVAEILEEAFRDSGMSADMLKDVIGTVEARKTLAEKMIAEAAIEKEKGKQQDKAEER